jgi:hypothetical protein
LIQLWIKGSFFKFAVREAAVKRITSDGKQEKTFTIEISKLEKIENQL